MGPCASRTLSSRFLTHKIRIAEHFVGNLNRSPHRLFPWYQEEFYKGVNFDKAGDLGHTTAIISLELGDKAAKRPRRSISKIQFLVQT